MLAGLSAGEQVVTSGQFLLDSEASLTGLDVRPIDQADDASTGGEDEPATFGATGTIQSIANGSVTLRHGRVPRLDWPAMTMTFEADAQILEQVSVGEGIAFKFRTGTEGSVVTSVTPR